MQRSPHSSVKKLLVKLGLRIIIYHLKSHFTGPTVQSLAAHLGWQKLKNPLAMAQGYHKHAIKYICATWLVVIFTAGSTWWSCSLTVIMSIITLYETHCFMGWRRNTLIGMAKHTDRYGKLRMHTALYTCQNFFLMWRMPNGFKTE